MLVNIKDKRGNLLIGEIDIMDRWKKYFLVLVEQTDEGKEKRKK